MSLAAFARARKLSPSARTPSAVTGVLSVVSSLLLVALLLVMGVTAELLVSRGDLRVPADEAASASELAGEPSASSDGQLLYENRGLLPTVWRLRGTARGALVRGAYEQMPSLRSNYQALFSLAMLGLAIAAVRSVSQYYRERAINDAAQNAATELRRAIYRQALMLESCEIIRGQRTSTRELFADRVETVRRGLVAWWRSLPGAVVSVALLLSLALAMEPWATLAAVLVGLLWWLGSGSMSARIRYRQRLLCDRAVQNAALLDEQLAQVRAARSLMLDDVPGEPFESVLARYRQAATERDNAAAAVEPLGQFVIAVGMSLVLFLAGINLLREPPLVSVAELMVLFAALLAAAPRALQLIELRRRLEPADEAAREVLAYLDQEPRIGQSAEATPLARLSDRIEFDQVCCIAADGARLLDGVSLTIPAGSRVALVASDRRVPLAVAGLLARLDEPASGRVLFDGRDLREATLESVRRQTTELLQPQLLFTASVAENVGCATAAGNAERLATAAKMAGAYDFVQHLPYAFDTVVGEHGLRLEASQTLRIALARALYCDPSVLVLEEPDEELDAEGAAEVDAALARLARRTTLVLLPTRLATLRSADRVFLFHEGKLAAAGAHAELLQSSELYRHIQYLRFNEFRGRGGS